MRYLSVALACCLSVVVIGVQLDGRSDEFAQFSEVMDWDPTDDESVEDLLDTYAILE
ncbi:MAG TPA: hypothetical protein VNJ01_01040 [Bacteriovoracaceae bacterium]|nr:hypothetical protein [Bacteriovoracaceae bacterium]